MLTFVGTKTTTMADLHKDFQYFLDHHDELVNLYDGKYVVIKDQEVVTFANTLEDGINKALELGFELGTFLVQLCTEGDSAYTQRFYSRAIFA